MIIKGVKVRVNKEQGSPVTEVFITCLKPSLNFSIYVDADEDIESGAYDIQLVPSKPTEATPTKPPTIPAQGETSGVVRPSIPRNDE